MRHKLDHEARLDWLQLIRTPSIGPITFDRLLSRFGDAGAALKALPELARQAGRKGAKPPPRADIEEEFRRAEMHGARLIAACEPEYPQALRAIAGYPPVIYTRGHTSLFQHPAVAIIGARNASAAGRKIARTLAADLGEAGVMVTSGLARGIDGAAHEGALASGTIAVVAGGVDVIYPPEHDRLTAEIAERGLIVSECPMGKKPTARDFPKRNRLISGLSRGVVVVEAGAKSGTLLTVDFANEQGREVFAVPGSPLDARSKTTNQLIRDGATLVDCADDVLRALASQTRGADEPGDDSFAWDAPPADDAELYASENAAKLRETVLSLLSYTPMHRDDILREAGAGPGLVADALMELVIAGDASEHPGGRFSLPDPD